ncbi:helix-turn-helix domain-containing protein [Solibacillus silvestris]|uniref:helix-turn-helix domain-containing protein n=1 Tax=Solibacillus silvestris TaxID=76853 RepID=UPI003F7D2E04
MPIINSIEFNILKASSLGERIKFLRQKLMSEDENKDYTIKGIAKRIDVPFQTLTSVERGDSQKPSIFLMNSIARDFNVHIEVFLDDYYEGEEKLFSFGVDDDSDVIDLDGLFGDDAINTNKIHIDEIEYKIGAGSVLSRRRNIHILINEEFYTGEQKNLYYHVLNMSESDLMNLLMNVIQQAELNPSTLSYNSWARALKVTPLNKAFEITNTRISELPNIDVELKASDEY